MKMRAPSWSAIMAAGLVCAGAAVPAGCGRSSGGPPAPTPVVAMPLTITGTVTDVLAGSALSGVTVTIDQMGSTASDATGQFVLTSQTTPGTRQTTLSGPTVVTRQTNVTLGSQPLSFTLIPSTFDMVAFDEFARSFADGAMIRWLSAPTLIVETSIVTKPDNVNAATSDQITPAEAERVIATLSQGLPAMTGSSLVSFESVITRTTPPGAAIRMYTPGVITVVHYTDDDGACGHGGPAALFPQIVAGAIWVHVDCTADLLGRLVMLHELGHALGYGHVTKQPSIMGSFVFRDISSFDRAAVSIVFERPAGSRSPDIDPDWFRITGDRRSIDGGYVILPPLP